MAPASIRRVSVACPQLPPAPPVPTVVALALPPNDSLPQPESKNLRIILQTLRSQEALEVQRFGCQAIRDLAAAKSEDRLWLGKLGAVELVLQAMRSFQEDMQVQHAGCGALAALGFECEVNAQLVLEHGGAELVVRAMLGHLEAAVWGPGCGALRMLSALAQARETLARLKCVEVVLQVLREAPAAEQVQGAGCAVLGRLTACGSEDLALCATLGAERCAIGALKQFPESAEVQACAIALLGNLACGDCLVEGGAQLAVAALKRHLAAPEVQDCAIHALRNMCLRSHSALAEAAGAGAFRALAGTLGAAEGRRDDQVRLLSTSVLHLLCAQGYSGADFVAAGGLVSLLPVLEQFTSLSVQEQIAVILQSFGAASDDLAAVLQQGGLPGILRAMHRYPASLKIQVSGCFLTSRWASGNEAAQVAADGAVELVVLAMQNHAEVHLQQLACVLLQELADRVPESLEVITYFGGVEAVLRALQRHEEGELQEQGVKALCSIGRRSQQCRQKVVDYGQSQDPSKAPSSIPAFVVRDDGARGKEVLRWTIWGHSALEPGPVSAYLQDDESEEEAEEGEAAEVAPPPPPPPPPTEIPVEEVRGVPLLFHALAHPHGEAASTLHSATCSLLAHIATDGDEHQALVLEEGGLSAAIASAALHGADSEVQVECFDLLQNLLGRPLPSGPSSLVQSASARGAVDLIIRALRSFPEHPGVLRSGARLLRSLVLGGDLSDSERSLPQQVEERLSACEGFAEGLRAETLMQELRRYSADVATRSTALGVVELLMGSLDTFKEPELQEIILAAYRDLAANRRSRHRMTVRGTWKQIMTEVQARQDLPQLQVFGCDLVELQTRDCEHDNIEDVIVFGGVESLLKVFATHAQDVDVQIRSCVAAEKLARRSADIKDMLIKGHLIQLIVDIMGRHRGSDVLQQLACMVLLSLVDVGPESRQEMVDSGCLEAACSALKEHDCWAVQCKALVLLAELAAAPEDTDARKLLASDGLRLVLKAMQVCVDSMEVQREGCSLLAAFGNDDASFFQAILNCDGLTAVVAGMRAHAAQNHVQQEATQLLRLIAEFSPEGKEDVISAGAIEAILDGMNENRKSDELALRGCVSLALLAKGNAAAVARIAKHKGAKHIVRAMLSNRTWAELQENALEALRAISADSEEVPGDVADNGGVQFVCQTLGDFKEYATIQEHGLAALANLAWDGAENQVQIGDLGGCEHAVEVMSLHKDNCKVQAFGCALLQSVACDSPEMRVRIGEMGGVEAIVEAMQANPKAANVQAFGASALQSLATQNVDNVRRCHKLKVVDIVANAMEAHPFSVKLREFGEMLTDTIEG